MRFIPCMVVFALAQMAAAGCASVPVPATKGATSPASPDAPEGRLQPLDLFPATAVPNAPPPAAPPSPAMPDMDHSPMDHSAAPVETYTCVMHPQIAESRPGTCPICGMPLVKKVKEKK